MDFSKKEIFFQHPSQYPRPQICPLHHKKNPSETIEQYTSRIKVLVDKLATASVSLEEEEILVHTLNGLPAAFNTFRTSIRTRSGTISLEELHTLLISGESTIEKSSATKASPTAFNAAVHDFHGSCGRDLGFGRLVLLIEKVHEAAVRERKTNDLGTVRISLNWPTQKDRSIVLKVHNADSMMDGLNVVGPDLIGPDVESEGKRGSKEAGRRDDGLGSFGPRNETVIGRCGSSVCGQKLDDISSGSRIEFGDFFNSGEDEPSNVSSGCVLNNQNANVSNVVQNGINKQLIDSKSTWASLFGTSSEESLLYTLPKIIGDKIVVTPPEEVIDQGIKVWENSLVGQLIDSKLPYTVIQHLVEKIWGKIEMPIITILENDLICFQFRRSKSVEWILSRGPWHLDDKSMLLRKWTPGIVPEFFVFNSVPVWIRLGKLPMELWTEAGLAVVASAVGKPISLDLATKERRRLSYARVCVELEAGSNMPAEITVSLRGVDFNVSVNYEWKPRKCNLCCAFGHSGSNCSRSVESKTIQEEVVHKGDDVDSEPCGEVVLESFKQLEEGEIRNSPNRHNSQVEKGVGKSDEFTLVTRRKSELVSVRDRGKKGSPPPLQVDEGTDILNGMKSKAVVDFLGSSSVGFCCLLETRVREGNFDSVSKRFSNSWDYSCSYSNSGVGRIWVMWKKNRFSFSTNVMDEQFITGVVMGDFNAIRVYSEAFGGSPIQGEMEDFDLAIRDVDLVEPLVQGNWFTWTSKVQGFQLNSKVVSFRFFNHWVEDPSFIEVVARRWSRHEGVSPLVSLMKNLHHLKPILRGRFGRHIKSLNEKVRIAKLAMDIAQRKVERNPMSDVLSRQASLATETFWTAVRLEEASLRQKSRIRWLKLGDQNTAFFHRFVYSRMSRNSLLSLVDSDGDGSRVSSHDGVVHMAALQLPISREEVRRVLLTMDSGKAPGPDGFSLGFFKVWVNATAITLIPKHNGAERLEDFRPISCFDLQKAYDSVNWDFLFGLLIAIGTLLKKGVRQGDPLSPFLFVMVMEVLSRMLNKIPQSFQFHHRCEKVKLTHLTFADDLMIFCAADELSIRFIRDCLQKFGELSGLFANPRKSSIFVAGVNNENASHLAACMGFVRGNLSVRYLGLPLLTGRLCSNDCAPLIQRITSQIRSWTARVLSFAGRMQLVCSVLRSLQVYWASVFVLPAYVHNEVDKILRSYLWRGKEEGRGGIKVAWVDVCLPFEEGGLGIRDGPSWNIASTLKILWLMLTNSGSLWVAWVEAYILKRRSLWDVDSRVGRSWCLRAILRKREKLKHHVRMKVGNGNRCRVWLDPWLQGGAILERLVRVLVLVIVGSGFLVVRVVSLLQVYGKLFVLGVVGFFGMIYCGVGEISQNIPFVRGWPLKIGWALEIDYIGGIVRVLRIMASSHRIGHWGVELSWICHQGIGKGVRRKLWRVLWWATIYFIWNEWNHRLHGGQARDPVVLFHLICS
ncbi:uncharacterized protein E5676_scaffold418G00380 [Cucumis melo var. makuwa]|uniref:Reverse transcriptase domain-containing protein n=1 Tax=Cucumis melo var. makuwa TaxID=1194695 RepID=A0A5D3D5X6_CUCMM|nr:uncharacterized protein E5676_scaffold418G00380 [Cucumis melo var. makuwa]